MRGQQRRDRRRRMPISISSCRRCCSAPSAPRDSAAPRRGGSIVHTSRVAEVVARLSEAYAQVKIGDPLDAGHADGSADRRDRGREFPRRGGRGASPPAANRLRRQGARRAGLLGRADDHRAGAQRRGRSCSARLSRRSSTSSRFDTLDEAIAHQQRRAARAVVGDLHAGHARRRSVRRRRRAATAGSPT